MHLKSIRIRGFKSFPAPVEVRLEPGVAVVVGPNGSGKSNVADAILWAAGTQSPSELRAERADDVLFAGGRGRPPASFAEVELLFDNADGAFGELDFAEVSVARRLHRGGEGQYLVNGATVRRLDVVELLSDVGLGGGFRAVIGQGRVEEILSSRPAERRELVEEAAGLGRFKRRRHRAELKLARVATQTERARDREAEVRTRLRPLALQATAAERAERLRGEIEALRAREAELELASLETRLEHAEEERAAAQLARKRTDAAVDELTTARDAAEQELADAAGSREAATDALYRLRGTVERLGLRHERARELVAALDAALEQARAAAAMPAGQLEALAREERAAEQALAAARAAAERSADALAAAERTLLEAGRERVAAAQAAEDRQAKLVRLRGAGERVQLRHEAAAALAARLRRELDTARAEARRSGPSLDDLRAASDAAEAASRAAARTRDDLLEATRLARERLAALERSLAEREGIPPAARALAESGEQLALALLEIEPGQERAVAAALGSMASALVAPDARAAFELVERAARSGLGSLRVLVGRDPRELVAALPVVPKGQLLRSRVPAVTAEGFGFDPQRGELWFAGETAEAVQLELETRRRELEREADELERRAHEATIAADRAAVAQAAADEAYLDAPRRTLPSPEGLEPVLTLSEALEQALAAAVARHAQLVELADPAAEATEVTAAEVDVEPLRADAEAAAERLGRATTRARAAAEARREALARTRGGDPAALARGSVLAWRLSAALAHSAERAARLEAPLRARADSGSVRTGALAARLRELSAQEGEARRAAQEAAERAAEVEVGLARLGAEVEEARRRRAELTAEPAEGDDPEELRVELDRLERRRETIGQVNPLAKEEYEREKERLDELVLQREDLELSLEELERLRTELAETVEQRFAETFEAVAANFAEVAKTLFPGGEGRLELVEPEGEGAEAGLEVVLRPAGKQVTRLQLLSGGEKALGAIAFLFALFLARPCPFYLLDEVEAALDDANIGRFVELLRSYADRAQFIVVTHQKRTMEAADLLYGVTMADGVSELVSRRLPREQPVAGAA